MDGQTIVNHRSEEDIGNADSLDPPLNDTRGGSDVSLPLRNKCAHSYIQNDPSGNSTHVATGAPPHVHEAGYECTDLLVKIFNHTSHTFWYPSALLAHTVCTLILTHVRDIT